MNDNILLAILTYNSKDRIIPVLNSLDEEVRSCISRILIVDEASTDGTPELIEAYIRKQPGRDNIRLLRNDVAPGFGGSAKMAFYYAVKSGFDFCILMRGGNLENIRDFLPVLQQKRYRRHDIVLGARFMLGSGKKGCSWLGTFANVGMNTLYSLVLKKKILDLDACPIICRVSILKTYYYKRFPDNLLFLPVLLLAADYYHHSVTSYPVSRRKIIPRYLVKDMNQALLVLRLLLRYGIRKDMIRGEFRERVLKGNEYK